LLSGGGSGSLTQILVIMEFITFHNDVLAEIFITASTGGEFMTQFEGAGYSE
jgi:hypothetical protein